MSERADLGKLKVLPIFYKVPTESVKQLVGEFGDHFRRREWEYRSEQQMIDRWKEVLARVSGKIGLVFDDKSLSESDFIGNIVTEVLILLEDITKNSQAVNKLQERVETSSSLNKNSKKPLKVVAQPKVAVQPSHDAGFTGVYDGFPVRYGNHETKGRGETSSMTNNTKKPSKSSKSNVEFNGWIS
ncbi:disease resistance protein LAZ5 isoform X2 [Capsella rubella]|nr:disease resistance protein LAZ5 isoform X2 [Capsella rubella]